MEESKRDMINITKEQIQRQLQKAKVRVDAMPKWKKTIIYRTRNMEIELGFLPNK